MHHIKVILLSSLIWILPSIGTLNGLFAQCISVNELSLAGATQFCEDGSALISAIGDFVFYEWNNGVNTQTMSTDSAGFYSVTVTDALGCTKTTNVAIEKGNDLGLIVAEPSSTCNIDTITLYAGYGFDVYEWDDGQTTPERKITTSGLYGVRVMDASGCQGVASIEIFMAIDSIAPVILSCPGGGVDVDIELNTGSCDESNPLIESQTGFPVSLQWAEIDTNLTFIPPVITDDLNLGITNIISYRDNITVSNCTGGSNVAFEIERTWRAEDLCQNFTECVQIIKLRDTQGPILVEGIDFFLSQDSSNPLGPFNFEPIFCPIDLNWNDPTEINLSDNCTAGLDIIVVSSTSSSSSFDEGITEVSYVLTDDCGNSTEYIFEINVECIGCDQTSGMVFSDCSMVPTLCDLNEINNFSSCTPEDTGETFGPFCNGGVLNNPSYFNFIAGASSINITIDPYNCSPSPSGFVGIQANVTRPCDASICFGSSNDDCFSEIFEFSATGLTVGDEYQIVVDGCSGSECLWSIEINSAPTFNILEVEEFVATNYDENCETIGTSFCKGSEVLFFPENLEDSEFYFCWSISNDQGVTALNESSDCLAAPDAVFNCTADFNSCGPLALSFEESGTYEICLVSIENGCDNIALNNYCYTVNIFEDQVVDFGTVEVCASSLPWIPDLTGPNGEQWSGNEPLFVGEHENNNVDDCNCSVVQRMNIVEIPEPVANVFIDICESDLETYENIDLGINWDDISTNFTPGQSMVEFTFTKSNGSLNTQANGTACDSMTNFQFFIYDLDGEVIRSEGPDCNTLLHFDLDEDALPNFMSASNVTYQWFDPTGQPLGTNETQEINIDGEYLIRLTYLIPVGTSCSYDFYQSAFDVSPPLINQFLDSDGDGFGLTNQAVIDCEILIGYATNAGDCNDSDPNIYPGAPEIENNGIDENCDGMDTTIGVDNDNDGFTDDVDCNDNDPNINPTAIEIPNNDIDENCDGSLLFIDLDGDGWNSDEDCDDNDSNINPAAVEIPNNDVDENCDGLILIIDNDGDGWNSDEDCNDNDSAINPGEVEIPNNTVDENCDGIILIIDEDGDGWNSDLDCDDTNADINPAAVEIPNNDIDENCDGSLLFIDLDGDGWNSDEDCNDNDDAINPAAVEIPNNTIDEDCDGVILIIDNDGDGWNSDVDCDDSNASINPGAEEIPDNEFDENCDGIIETTSSNENLISINVQLFPNPVIDQLNIESDQLLDYKILSATGIVYEQGRLTSDKTSINCQELVPGLYFILFMHEGDLLRTDRFIKI